MKAVQVHPLPQKAKGVQKIKVLECSSEQFVPVAGQGVSCGESVDVLSNWFLTSIAV